MRPTLISFGLILLLLDPARATSLRFFGFGDQDVDRVKILIDDVGDPNDEPGPPVDVGATDFTIEFWVKGLLAENGAPATSCGFGEDWIYGNIVLDRDRWSPGGRDFGLSFGDGYLSFGVTNELFESRTICGSTMVLDGSWHHVAVQRRASDGRLWIYVDGDLDAEADGPDGDVSYPGDQTPDGNNCDGGPCFDSDPYVVLAAEKHDAGPSFPSFSGWIDEIRFSTTLRYDGIVPAPTAPFTPDAFTVALYHLDEESGDDVLDSSGAPGGPSHGVRRFGGSPIPGPVWSPDTPFSGASSVALPSGSRGLPGGARLHAYPNPSLAQVVLFARVPDPANAEVRISIHDVQGRFRDETSGRFVEGSMMAIWNRPPDGFPPGVYYARLTLEGEGLSAKFVLR